MNGVNNVNAAQYRAAVLRLWKRSKQTKTITISGQSMLPFLRRGDQVRVECGSTDIRRGDIVVFYRQGQLMAHRVVGFDRTPSGRACITKGDNCGQCDAPLAAGELVGRVSSLKRGPKSVSLQPLPRRAVNWLIAVTSLAAAKGLGWGARIKRRVPGVPGRQSPPASRKTEATAPFGPEVALLLQAGARPAHFKRERLTPLLAQRIDWARVLSLARRHGLLPLLYWHLKDCQADLPGEVRSTLETYFQLNAARNVFLTKELLRILQALADHGLEAVPFKGPVLAELAYRNLALREFCDLDIWLPRDQIIPAKDVLLAQGYRLQNDLTESQLQFLLHGQNHNELTFERTGGVIVDLHWAIFPPLFFPTGSDLRARLTYTSLAGVPVRTFAAEDLPVLLCIHGSKHRWERLEWLCAVAELVRRPAGLNWSLILERATQTGSDRMLCLGLALAHDLFAVTLPPAVHRRIRADSAVEGLVSTVQDSLFDGSATGPGTFGRWLFHCRLMPGRTRHRQHLKRLVHMIFVPSTIELAQLPLAPCFLHYLWRPIRLAGKHSAGWGRRLLNQDNP